MGMRKINWQGYEWITQERWGQVHPEKSHWWYDESCVEVDQDNTLHLKTKYNPKYFEEIKIESKIGVGLVSCTTEFGFGTFSVESKLPKGEYLWPAFWMWSWDSWPPEIDVFEGYSNSKGSYLKPRLRSPLGFWNIQTNVHYNDPKPKMMGGLTCFMGFKNPAETFIEYKVIWKENLLEFYYNNRLVRKVKDKYILDQLSKKKMNVVINNGVTSEVNLTNPPVSDFQIKNFIYEPLK